MILLVESYNKTKMWNYIGFEDVYKKSFGCIRFIKLIIVSM
jgi:hypothetical protein